MGRSVKELRERAAEGSLDEGDITFLKAREGIGVYDSILAQADEAEFADEDDSDDGDEGYNAWVKKDLQAELDSRGLDTRGNKEQLVARLEEADAGLETDTEDE